MAAIKEIGNTIGRMSEISSTIAAAVEEQGAATQEISRNIQHAATGTQEVSSNITDVQHGATETGSASAQVHSAAKSLSSESNRLKLEVSKFLNSVRAENRLPPPISLEDARGATMIGLLVRKAVDERRLVTMEEARAECPLS